ncbi:MAG: hypothetical protein ABII27_00405 [bacterium]
MHKRSIYIIKRGFQLRYTRLLITMLAIFCALIVINSIVFINTNSAIFSDIPAAREAIITFTKLLLIILVSFGAGLALYSIYVSHKVAGPMYRFEQVLSALCEGDLTVRSNIRKDDELKDFQEVINNTILRIHSIIKEDKEKIKQASVIIKELKENIKADPQKHEPIIEIISKLESKIESVNKFFKT